MSMCYNVFASPHPHAENIPYSPLLKKWIVPKHFSTMENVPVVMFVLKCVCITTSLMKKRKCTLLKNGLSQITRIVPNV